MMLPGEFKERMKKLLGAEYADFESCMELEPVSGVRIKAGAEETVLSAFPGLKPTPWCRSGYYGEKLPGSHPFHLAGLYYSQEPSSMCPGEALPLEEGDLVLDLCAAPGGKSTHIASRMRGGFLVSNEIHPKRAGILLENIRRMGIENCAVINEDPKNLERKFPVFFDKVLVDAPCSGEGMFRKEKAAVEDWSVNHVLSCAIRQKSILDSAVKMLRPGGMLMYSTCTYAPEEDEGVCEYLIRDKGLELIHMDGLSMLEPGRGEYIGSGLDLSAARRAFPHKIEGEGQFLALFKKPGHSSRAVLRGKSADFPLWEEFARENLRRMPEGFLTAYGGRLFCRSVPIDFSGIRTLSPGLYLGDLKKNRFEPSQALAAAIGRDGIRRTIELAPDSPELHAYLCGEEITADISGWCAVTCCGFPLGWGKGSGGRLKNKFPKQLRLMR